MSIFGIRNLIHEAIDPQIIVRLTNKKCLPDDAPQEFKVMLDQEWINTVQLESTCNPNIGDFVEFPKIFLPKEPLCWPYLEI